MSRHRLTGPEVCSLMRRHHVTIRLLKARMGITLKRIRQVRADGIRGHMMVRDWIEGITLVDPGPIGGGA